jgi:very-short-patch-repair endonuclease
MQGVERSIARIAGRQDNVISWEQLLGAGLGRGAIAHRVQAGSMQRLHRTVYLLGAAPPTLMGRVRAAAMACGADAVVSHRSAAEVFGLLPEAGGDVDVTVAGRNFAPRAGIRRHRVGQLPRHEVTTVRGIRVTSVARTICDLAATEPAREVEAAFQEALYRRIVTERPLVAIIEREPRRRGAPVIRALVEDPRMTRSEKERALLRLIDAAQLPRPVTNVRVHGYLIDAYWPAERLAVEFDGRNAHDHRLAFDANRKRDQVLLAHGVRPMRVTGRHLGDEPVAVAARIAQALRAA